MLRLEYFEPGGWCRGRRVHEYIIIFCWYTEPYIKRYTTYKSTKP